MMRLMRILALTLALLKLETYNDFLFEFFDWNVNEPDKVWKAWDAYETHKTESYFAVDVAT